MKVIVSPLGSLLFVYGDDRRELLDAGQGAIRRASHVEPRGTEWVADLAPVAGPILGPFTTRQEALAAELAWLDAHMLEIAASCGRSSA